MLLRFFINATHIDFINFLTTAVDGGYSDWTEWTECDRTCGTGHQTRERICNNPLPSNRGRDCSVLGKSTEVRECKNDPCSKFEKLLVNKFSIAVDLYLSQVRII